MRLRPDSSGAYPKCCRTELCLDIISRIAHRGSVSKQSLIREMNVSERTIERNMKLISEVLSRHPHRQTWTACRIPLHRQSVHGRLIRSDKNLRRSLLPDQQNRQQQNTALLNVNHYALKFIYNFHSAPPQFV